MSNKVTTFIANNIVSWILEITVLSVIAFYTISENRKTQEQTRQMISNFETRITAFAEGKAAVIDENAAGAKKEVLSLWEQAKKKLPAKKD